MRKYFQLTYCNFTKLNLTSRMKVRCSTECFALFVQSRCWPQLLPPWPRGNFSDTCALSRSKLSIAGNPVAVPLTSASFHLQVTKAVLWNNLVIFMELSQYYFFLRIHTILPRNCAVITDPNSVDITAHLIISRLVIYVIINPPERSGSCVVYRL
jgi:hypothetical protein